MTGAIFISDDLVFLDLLKRQNHFVPLQSIWFVILDLFSTTEVVNLALVV